MNITTNSSVTLNPNTFQQNNFFENTTKIIPSPPALIESSATGNLKTASKLLFSQEEDYIVIHFKNGGKIEELNYKQLVMLSSLYTFTTNDLIALKNNIEFIKYLHVNKIVEFSFLPVEVKKNVAIAEAAIYANYPEFIEYIPKEKQTQELCEYVINSFLNKYYITSYDYLTCISAEYQTQEMWYKIIDDYQKSYYKYAKIDKLLECLLKINYTPKLIQYFLQAVLFKDDVSYLKDVVSILPQKFQNKKICNILLDLKISNFILIDDKFKTYKLCEEYIDQSSSINFAAIPNKFQERLQQKFINRVIINSQNQTLYEVAGIELIPNELLVENPSFLVNYILHGNNDLETISPKLITPALLVQVAKTKLRLIPQKYMSLELVTIGIENMDRICLDNLNIIDTYYKQYPEVIQQTILKKVNVKKSLEYVYLEYIIDKITEQKFLKIVKNNDIRKALFPKCKILNKDILYPLLGYRFEHNKELDVSKVNQYQVQEIFNSIPQIPKWETRHRAFMKYILAKKKVAESIPEQYRSIEIWIYLCNNVNRKHVNKIPKEMITTEVLSELVNEYVKWHNCIDINFITYILTQKIYDANSQLKEKILAHSLQCCARFSSAIISILKSAEIPNDFKNELWEHIKLGEFKFYQPKTEELYSKVNPLQRAITAHSVTGFLSQLYKKNNTNNLSLSPLSQSLTNYLAQSVIKQLPADTTENIFTDAKVKGGRTIQVNISDTTAIFYKFRKPSEELEDFTKEGLMYEFFEHTNVGKAFKNKLKSDIPILNKMVSIATKNLPDCVFKCEDGIAKYTDKNGIEVVDCLVFYGSKYYLEYAHKPDEENPQCPFLRPIQGLLDACHDLGRFMAVNIYHTSTLPAYHFAREYRQWSALHMLLRDVAYNFMRGEYNIPIRNDLHMVGKLEDWDTKATERPDYGYTGLRDLADCDIGIINSTLKRLGCCNVKLFSTIKQGVLVANTVCESLLAVVLLYARLHKNSDDYHYKNQASHEKTLAFIEKVFTSFLEGATSNTAINLQNFMQLTDNHYNAWLNRMVTEILYWTKLTPSFSMEDANTYKKLAIDKDDFAKWHIRRKELPIELYDDLEILHDSSYYIEYEENNLGMDNGTFPLLALLNFMFVFNKRLSEDSILV